MDPDAGATVEPMENKSVNKRISARDAAGRMLNRITVGVAVGALASVGAAGVVSAYTIPGATSSSGATAGTSTTTGTGSTGLTSGTTVGSSSSGSGVAVSGGS
jgi:hypothetical protein